MMGITTTAVIVRRKPVGETVICGYHLLHQLVQLELQRVQTWIGYVELGGEEVVPVAYGNEQRDGGDDGLLQGQNDGHQPAHVACAVQIGGFFQLSRQRFDRCFDQNHVVYADQAGDDVDPEGVEQAQHLVVQVAWNQTCGEVHGDDDQTVPELAAPHVFLRKEVGHVGVAHNG